MLDFHQFIQSLNSSKTFCLIDVSYNKADIAFFKDEWTNRRIQCENYAKSVSGRYDETIYARNCIVVNLNKIDANDFIEKHHLQGKNNLGLVYFGLIYNNQIVGVMSLGRHSRQGKNNLVVLDRLCFKSGTRIPGGASRLLKHCIEWARLHKYDEIISFSDNRLSQGNVYEKLNFKLDCEYRPDYCYVEKNNTIKRYSKQSQKKKSVSCPKEMTELEWATYRGLIRLFDYGKKRWSLKINENYIGWSDKKSYNCALQHSNGIFKHNHIRGYYKSSKSGDVYYGSSYELRCLYLLDQDESVIEFKRGEVFKGEQKSRNPDIIVIKNDGIWLYEIKPHKMIKSAEAQIADTINYAKNQGYKFKLWEEKDSGFENEKEIISWAKQFIANITGDFSIIEKQKQNNKERTKKYQENHYEDLRITFYCEYCKEFHKVRKYSYNKNIQKNNRYICEREGGHISGCMPKPHLRKHNPFAIDGKKQCSKCNEIKLLIEFNKDKSRRDGYNNRCKGCSK